MGAQAVLVECFFVFSFFPSKAMAKAMKKAGAMKAMKKAMKKAAAPAAAKPAKKGLLLQDLVGLVPDHSGDVVGLRRATRRVDKDDAALSNEGVVEGPGEEFVVRPVHGVAALEGDDINVVRKGLADFRRGFAGEIADWKVQAGDLTTHIVLTALGGDHERAGVLDLRCSVALQGLVSLVGQEFVGELNGGNVAVAILEEDFVTGLKILIVSVEHNRKTKDQTTGKSEIVNDMLISFLVHKSGKRRESTIHNELNIAELTRAQL